MAKADLNRFGKDIIKAARNGLKRSSDRTKERLKQNVGLTDHSIDDLFALGNPYSLQDPKALHNPTPPIPGILVHKQSGELYNSIKIVKENEDSYAIGADEELRDPETGVRYVIDVIEGNSKMLARNYPLFTLNELINNNIIYDTIEAELAKVK